LGARLLLVAALGFAVLNDAYNVANTLPNQVYELLLGGVLSAAAIPVLVRAQRTDPDGGDEYAQRLLTMGVVALVIGTIAAVAAVDRPDDGPRARAESASGHRVRLPAAAADPVLRRRRTPRRNPQQSGRFAAPAWAPVANNLVLIAGVVTYLNMDGQISLNPTLMGEPKLWVLGVGTTIGIVVQAAVLIPALRRSGFRWRWRWGWDPRLGCVRWPGRLLGSLQRPRPDRADHHLSDRRARRAG
jgi:putative peptidoglycan lipid II flippase